MLKRISFTMAVVYGLIIIATISTLDFLIILTYRQEQLDKNQDRQIAFAEIIGNVVKDKLDDIMELNGTMRENSAKLDGRVLIVNKENKVLADNYAYYIGKQLDNDEVVRVIESKEQAIQYYHMDNQNIMIVATPILENKQLTGVVLISVSVDQIYQDVKDLEHQVIIISVIACIIAIFLSFIFGRKLSSPIEKLTAASEEILRGKLDTKVDIVRNDEIGKLQEEIHW
ncbi:MAG: two-component sensor histidine kinase [Clostridia bacterium]|nr:two-component sensor histidine kinase [Clostridia bacterium]